MFMNANDAA